MAARSLPQNILPIGVYEDMSKKRGVGDEAMRYLSHRMRTEQEMRQHLKEKEYEDSEIEGAIDDLKAHHYIDDYEYALAFYRIASMARKLENRGYTSGVIYKVISEMRSWKVKSKR